MTDETKGAQAPTPGPLSQIPTALVADTMNVMARAYERIHSMPRVSDTELAIKVGEAKERLRPFLAPTAPVEASGQDDDLKLIIAHTIIEDLRVQHPDIEQIDNERGDIWLPGGSTPQSSGCIVDIHSVAQSVEQQVLAALRPGHTDLMVSPESIDALLEANPPPVEASGSEREHWSVLSDLHTIKGWLHGLSTAPDLTDVVADGGVSVGDCYQQEAREFAGRLGRVIEALRPQPSGETRGPGGYLVKDFADGWYWTPNAAIECATGSPVWSVQNARYETKAEALFSPAPVASGGQHSSGEAAGCAESEVGRAVYERIEKLIDAKPGTPEGDELSFLAFLVESVEEVGGYDGPSASTPARAEAQDEGAALSASDRACYEYPGKNQSDLRAAFVAGACFIAAHPSPTPAADADGVRIAVEAIWEIAGGRATDGHNEAGRLARIKDRAAEALAALKSTAAKEGGEG